RAASWPGRSRRFHRIVPSAAIGRDLRGWRHFRSGDRSLDVVVERHGKWRLVSAGESTFSLEPSQLPGSGPRHDREGRLCHAALARPDMLEHEAPCLASQTTDDPFQADIARRAILTVCHEVLDPPFALDVSPEGFLHARARELRPAPDFFVGLLVPVLD